MIDWITSLIEQYEYFGIFLLILIENIFPPIPSEIILPLSGFAVSQGKLDPLLVLLSATLGSLAGAVFWYLIGKWIGQQRLERFIHRHGRWLAISTKDYEKTTRFFEKHCGKAVFVGRMIPAFRTLISIPAGLVKMPWGKFLLYSSAGTLLWSGLLIYAGYALEDEYQQISNYIDVATNLIIGGIVVLYFYRLLKHQRAK
jgi:membrane protein DedA with SNARE-associated domain